MSCLWRLAVGCNVTLLCSYRPLNLFGVCWSSAHGTMWLSLARLRAEWLPLKRRLNVIFTLTKTKYWMCTLQSCCNSAISIYLNVKSSEDRGMTWMKLKVLRCNSQMFAQVVVRTITISLQNLTRLYGLCLSDAVKMSYNFKYICGLRCWLAYPKEHYNMLCFILIIN